MRKIGIIPAAGVGSRWGGYPKFLLPCGEREWLLDRAIKTMPAEKVVIVYGDATGAEIVRHIDRCNLNERVSLRSNERMDLDFWGSILAGLEEYADYYYFAMPDTYPDISVFGEFPMDGISLGLHQTNMSERFGMLRNGAIVNKQMGKPGLAWGVLGWSREVRDLWLAAHLETYTDAINLAMQELPWHGFKMEYYFDMANFESYVDFLKVMR
jgi:hypothetical protein